MTPYKKKAFQRSEVEVEENLQEKKISKGLKLKSTSAKFLEWKSAQFCGVKICADLRPCRCAVQKQFKNFCADLQVIKNLRRILIINLRNSSTLIILLLCNHFIHSILFEMFYVIKFIFY